MKLLKLKQKGKIIWKVVKIVSIGIGKRSLIPKDPGCVKIKKVLIIRWLLMNQFYVKDSEKVGLKKIT